MNRVTPVCVAGLLACASASAFEFDTGNKDLLSIRWDNTFKYSNGIRLKNPSPVLIDPAINAANVNQDDGDRNFRKGALISNRLDVLSEFDVVYRKDMGLRVSAAGWYDAVYNRGNSNDSPSTSNAPLPNEFPEGTRKLHGRKAEILDAFVFANADVGDKRVQGKLGRHTVLWGESLFFAGNGIAAGQAPLDLVKLSSVPSTQAKEYLLPVGQLSGQVQLSTDFALAGYYQYEWRRTRLPGEGSYFSGSDALDAGASRLLVGNGIWNRGPDETPSRQGQFGLAAKTRIGKSDVGFYALQYHSKMPVIYADVGANTTYSLVFPEKIRLYGVSANYTIGEFNIAGEASIRQNDVLTSNLAVRQGGVGDNNGNPLYAVGKTAHINVNTLAVFGKSFLAPTTALLAEVAWNRMLSCQKNCTTTLDPGITRDAWGFRVLVAPTYFEVFPNTDLTPTLSAAYSPKGRSPSAYVGVDRGGDISLGVDAVYMTTWKAGLSYTHYYGKAAGFLNAAFTNTFQQNMKDRDFVSFTITRTF